MAHTEEQRARAYDALTSAKAGLPEMAAKGGVVPIGQEQKAERWDRIAAKHGRREAGGTKGAGIRSRSMVVRRVWPGHPDYDPKD